MRLSMLDILACPIDKHYPLELTQIDASEDTTVKELVIKEGVLFVQNVLGFIRLLRRFLLCYLMICVTKKKIFNFYKNGNKRSQARLQNAKPWHL